MPRIFFCSLVNMKKNKAWSKKRTHSNLYITGQRCIWTRQRLDPSGEPLGYGPIYDWSCEPQSSKNATYVEEMCHKRCHKHKSCQDCLDSSGGAEGGKVLRVLLKYRRLKNGYYTLFLGILILEIVKFLQNSALLLNDLTLFLKKRGQGCYKSSIGSNYFNIV